MSEHAPVAAPAEDGTMSPSVGLSVIHLFAKPTLVYEADEFVAAVKEAEAAGVQVVCIWRSGCVHFDAWSQSRCGDHGTHQRLAFVAQVSDGTSTCWPGHH